MTRLSCSVDERFVNPLFEVFDGGDFILSSYRDIEEPQARMQIFLEHADLVSAARTCLAAALEIVGVSTEIRVDEIRDEDWKFAYRRHFKTEAIGRRLLTVPAWEKEKVVASKDACFAGRQMIVLDPGMAFGTGKHETTRACLEFIDACAPTDGRSVSFLDMGCGSGILSIAAKKLGFDPVVGFDVDDEAVRASIENAALNGTQVNYVQFALGRVRGGKTVQAPTIEPAEFVVANILGPLLIRFADEIATYAPSSLVISGILTELYPEVLAAYALRGYREISHKTIGEWTTGLLRKGVVS